MSGGQGSGVRGQGLGGKWLPTEPFQPRRGLVRLPVSYLVLAAIIGILAVLYGIRAARLREGPVLADGLAGIPQAEVLQRAETAKRSAQMAEARIREAKRAAAINPDPSLLPIDSALLGDELTPLVTTLGSLEAKRLASNPDWARVLTLRLYKAGIRAGDVVAAGLSGSFPGLNISLNAACGALGVELIAISSVTASTWGANQPGFTWPEMESFLDRSGIIRRATVAISLGGQGDIAADLEPQARELARQIQESCARQLGADILSPQSIRDAISERWRIYARHSHMRRIALYVNIGGTEASLGVSPASWRLRNGFIPGVPFDLSAYRGIIAEFASQGIPTLSLLHIEDLALRWGIAQH